MIYPTELYFILTQDYRVYNIKYVHRSNICCSTNRADAEQPSVPEAPTLTSSVKGSSVELLCQAPQGSGGVEFKLFRVHQKIDTKTYSSKQRDALFVLKGEDTKNENLYCCQYDRSMISSYVSLEMKCK